MRKLVTIRQVSAIRPIAGADAIECASVDGWLVVVKKNEFQVGDACVYFEIDSFLPLNDARFAFLAKNKIIWEEQEGIRLCTVKLRGQISQGLILPLSTFPEFSVDQSNDQNYATDIDLAQMLGIKKWEAPIPASLSGEVEGAFPSFIRKTEQERIQNLPELLISDINEEFEVTIKLDGSSMTVFHHDGVSGICTRNWWIKDSASNSLWRVARKNNLLEALAAYGRKLALQGEIIGEGIQGNPEKLRGQEFYLFDIYDVEQGQYLGKQARDQVVADLRSLGATLSEVPCLGSMTLARFKQSIASLLDFAEGPSLNPDTSREGLVFKRLDGGVSFKVISNSYLLKHADR